MALPNLQEHLIDGTAKSAELFWGVVLPNLHKLFWEGRYEISHGHYIGLVLQKL
jgi:hypothetical protein